MDTQNYFQNSNFINSCTTSFSKADQNIIDISSILSIKKDVIFLVKQYFAGALYQRSENYHFDDDAICFPDAELKRNQNETSSNQLWDISIVPNSASNILNVMWDNSNKNNEEVNIVLMDLQGKTLKSKNEKVNTGNVILDVSNLSAGVYLLQGSDNSGVQFIEKAIIKK